MFQLKASKRFSLTSTGFAFAKGEVTPARCKLMVGPNQSQFEFLSAACGLWLMGLGRVRLPVALTPHPKDPRLGKLFSVIWQVLCCALPFCLLTAFVWRLLTSSTLRAWPNHWVIFGFKLQVIPVSIGPTKYFQSQEWVMGPKFSVAS